MKRPLAIAAAIVAFAGVTAYAATPDDPVEFSLDCTLAGGSVVCTGQLPEETAGSTTETTTSTSSTPSSRESPVTTPPETSAPSTSERPEPGSTTSSVPIGDAFLATFGTPNDFYDRFWTYAGNYCDFGTTCRWSEGHNGNPPYQGDHNMNCQGPTTQRTVNPDVHNENFWWCAPNGAETGHVMLGMSTQSYSISGFAPARSFTDVRQICWDLSLADLGGGKWFTVTVVPWEVFTSHPNTNPRRIAERESPYRLDYTLPEFDNPAETGLFNLQRQPRWMYRVHQTELSAFDEVSGTGSYENFSIGYVAGNDTATRFKHCLTENSAGDVIATQQTPTGVTTVNTGTTFPTGPVAVIFADDTYNDHKHDGRPEPVDLVTWHVDNISISS